jgi:hypothetical protein
MNLGNWILYILSWIVFFPMNTLSALFFKKYPALVWLVGLPLTAIYWVIIAELIGKLIK